MVSTGSTCRIRWSMNSSTLPDSDFFGIPRTRVLFLRALFLSSSVSFCNCATSRGRSLNQVWKIRRGDSTDSSRMPMYREDTEMLMHRLIRENSDLFTDGQCKVCSAVLVSESQKLSHYQSKKHASKVRRYMAIHKEDDFYPAKKMKTDRAVKPELSSNDAEDRYKCCPICNMTFSAPVTAASHYEGKPHAKNLRLKEQGPAPPGVSQKAPSAPRVAESAGSSDSDKYCSLCDATFNNPLMAQQHYAGKKHKKNLTKKQLGGGAGPTSPAALIVGPQLGYHCEDCNINLNSIEQYQAHISGIKHRAVVRGKRMGQDEPPKPTWRRQQPRPPPPPFQHPFRPEDGGPEDGYGFFDRNY